MRYVLAWAAALVAAMLGSGALLTALVPAPTVTGAVGLNWGVNARPIPDALLGVSVSAANRGSGLVLPPEPGETAGPTAQNAISGTGVLRSSILRFPDDISQSYHWATAFGSSSVDTDRFASLADLAHVPQMMITVNMMDGTEFEARNWVEYANGAASTQFGQVRAGRSSTEPFGVQYWLLGEDITSRPDRYPSALSYAEAAVENATLMKVVSPGIQVGLWVAPGDTEEERAWNDALITSLKALDPGQANPPVPDEKLIDFLAVAVTVDVPNRPVTDATLFESLYGYAEDRTRAVLERAEQVNQLLNPSLPLAVYRFGLEFADDGWNQDKGDSMGATVAVTGMLNEFMRHDSLFTIIYHGLNTDDYGAVLKVSTRYDTNQFELNPVGEVLASFAQYLAGRSIQPEFTGVGATPADASRAFYRAPALGRIAEQERVALVSVGSCFDTNLGQMVIWMASRAKDQQVSLHVTVRTTSGYSIGPQRPDGTLHPLVQRITAPTIGSDRYTGFEHVSSAGAEEVFPLTATEPGVFEFDITLPPHSVTTVVFSIFT